MNTKRVNSAAGVILAALTQNRTPAGIALALESAGLLMTPETAADMESLAAEAVELLDKAVAELKREHAMSARLRERIAELEQPADGITRLIAPTQALREDRPRAGGLTADEFNDRYPVGTEVRAYPDTREDPALNTRTRSRAWNLGHGLPVVMVDGYSGGICLTHIDPVTSGVPQ